MVKADNGIGVDFYDFRVRLRNEGSSTVREFRVEIEIPDEFLKHSGASYSMEVQNHNRPGVRLFRATEKHWPGTVIYPDSTSEFQISLDFQVPVARYTNITRNETIRVKVFANDAPVSIANYVIAEYLSEDRCNQLWAAGRERPEALRHPRKFFPPRRPS
jgi:hypothetical protein